MAPDVSRNVRPSIFSCILAVLFVMKLLTNSQLYRLSKFIGSHYGNIPLKLLRHLEAMQKKEVRHIEAIKFQEKCSIYNLRPKFLKFRLYKSKLTDTKEACRFRRTLLRKEILFQRRELNSIQRQKKNKIEELRLLTSSLISLATNRFLVRVKEKEELNKRTLNKKLCKLGLNLTTPTNILHNLSNRTLTTIESELLNKGLDYSFYHTRLDIQHVRAKFENLYSKLRNVLLTSQCILFKQKLISLYSRFVSSFYHDRFRRSSNSVLSNDQKDTLYSLRNDPNIIITRTDKGNGVVILNRCDYVNKMYDILNDKPKFLPCNHDTSLANLIKFQRSIYYLKTKKALSDEIYSRIHPTSTTTPSLYGLP